MDYPTGQESSSSYGYPAYAVSQQPQQLSASTSSQPVHGEDIRRKSHLRSERRRRDAFNTAIDEARDIIPGYSEGFWHSSQAKVISDCIRYIRILEEHLLMNGIPNPIFVPEHQRGADPKSFQKPSRYIWGTTCCSTCNRLLIYDNGAQYQQPQHDYEQSTAVPPSNYYPPHQPYH